MLKVFIDVRKSKQKNRGMFDLKLDCLETRHVQEKLVSTLEKNRESTEEYSKCIVRQNNDKLERRIVLNK